MHARIFLPLARLVIAGLFFAPCLSGTVSLRMAPGGADQAIEVTVADASTHTAVPNARVFVLDDRGAEIGQSLTDKKGVALLSVELEGKKPKYLLAEEEHYYISGLRWLAGSRDYYILTNRLVVR